MWFKASRPMVTPKPSRNSDFLSGPLIARSLVATVRPFFLWWAYRWGESHWGAVILAPTAEARQPKLITLSIRIEQLSECLAHLRASQGKPPVSAGSQ